MIPRKLDWKDVPIVDIKPYKTNPKMHSPAQINLVAKSLTEFGWTQPICVDKNMTLIFGHCRLESAKQLGEDTVPVVFREDLSTAQVKALRILDNKSNESPWNTDLLEVELAELQGFDYELEDVGFDLDGLDDIRNANAKYDVKEDDFDIDGALQEEPFSKTGDLWTLGLHRLLCGDSTEAEDVARLMDGKKADLFLTDPPYGVGYADKNAFLDAIGRGNHIQERIKGDHQSVDDMALLWLDSFIIALEFAKAGCPYYISSPQGGELMMMMMMMIVKAGWELKHCLIWVKNNHVLGRSDYNYKHEPILYGWEKGGHKFYGTSSEVSTWEINKPLKSGLHPTMKPIALCAKAICNSSRKDEIVLDLFGGSGSTLIACEELNRICFMMELDEHYCDVIVKRYINHKGTDADVFLEREGKKIPYGNNIS